MSLAPKLIFATLILFCSTIEISGAAFKCPSDWKTRDVYNSVDCYFYGDKSFRKFSDARDFCKNKGSQLVSIHTADENEWIKKNRPFGTSDYWIGWVHADGKDFWGDSTHVVDYNHFEGSCIGHDCNRAVVDLWGRWKKVSEENIHGPKALCKMIENKGGVGNFGWVDPNKQNNKVTRPPFKCQSGWKTRDIPGNVECYWYGDKSYKKYSDARDYCKNHRSKLVSIHSDDENEWIKSNHPTGISSYWTGYIHIDGKDQWNDKQHPIGSYTKFEGISTCISNCNSAVVDNWGKWSKVNGENYIHGANALCKMTEEEYYASDANPRINVPIIWALTLISICLVQIFKSYF